MKRIDRDDAINILSSSSLHEIGKMAHEIRLAKHNNDIVTYIADRNINYTNICVSQCRFCAFYKSPDDTDGYVLNMEEINRKIAEAIDAGGTQILLQGGLNPNLTIDYYTNLVTSIKSRFDIHLHGFSPPEIAHIAKMSDMATLDVLRQLKSAGLDTIPGGGAEILSNDFRKTVSPNKCNSDDWLRIMREAHDLEMRTTATMMFGIGESIHHRIEHLERIRALQDDSGGFTAFIPWTFQPMNTNLSDLESPSAIEYLKMLAISRIYLDNIDNIQASWVTQGEKIGQLALFFGANDMGGTMMEENVVRAAGCENRTTESRIREIISKAGFTPRKRNTLYELID